MIVVDQFHWNLFDKTLDYQTHIHHNIFEHQQNQYHDDLKLNIHDMLFSYIDQYLSLIHI